MDRPVEGSQLPFGKQAVAIRSRVVAVSTLFLLCASVGVIAGLGAAGFHYLLGYANHLFLDSLAGYRPEGPLGEESLFTASSRPFSRWVLFILPAAGALVSGIFVYWLAPEAEGHGTDAAIDAYHHKGGAIRARIPFVKTIASAIVMGTGGSAGREGPIAQIGAGLGSNIAYWLGLSNQQRRILLAAGMGAGIGAIFRAPLAGALFAGEVLYGGMDIEFEVIAPAILSSIVGYSTFGMIFGWKPLFETPNFTFNDPRVLGLYLILAIAVAGGGRLYAQVFYGIRDRFHKLKVPQWIKPAIGGLIVGAIGLVCRDALGTGFGVVQNAIFGVDQHSVKLTAGFLFTVALAKLLTTSFSIGSGGSGGVFGPAVVIGGALGGGFGILFHQWFPALVPEPGAFAMVGMAGFFSAAAHVPISTVIMVSEMTGNYHLLVPSMFVCMLGNLLVRRHTIYEQQLASRADSPAHRREGVLALLERLRVRDVLEARPGLPPAPVLATAPMQELIDRFTTTAVASLPVLDGQGALIGQVDRDTWRERRNSGPDAAALTARQIAVPPATITREGSIRDALRIMSERNVPQLLVVDPKDANRVEAIVTGGDVNAIFDEFIHEIVQEEPPPGGIRGAVQRLRATIENRGET